MRSCGKTLLHSGLIFSLAVMSCSTGCKSMGGWKMPSWFSRQPDADKLAGGKDTTTPTSPASKYAPSAIASNVVKPTSPSGTTPSSTTPGSTTPSSSMAGSTTTGNRTPSSMVSTSPTTPTTGLLGNSATRPATPPNNPSGGLAGQANGYTIGNVPPSYTTGPYNTTAGKTVSGPTSPSMSGGTITNQPVNSSPTVSSPYGGTYGGSYAGVTSTTTPNIAQGQLPPNLNTGFVGATPQATQAIMPQAQGNLGYSAVPTPTDYPSIAGGSGYSSPGYTATASGTSQASGAPNVATGGTIPAASAYQSATPATAYAPGTTGRQSPYNFSPNASAAPAASNMQPAAQPNNRFLPPNTASGDTTLMR